MGYRVYVTRRIPEAGLELVQEFCETTKVWEEEVPPPKEVLLGEVAEVDGLLCLLTDRVDAEIMDAGKKLRVISNYAVGYDNLDIPAATQRKIIVGNTPGVLTETTADLAFSLLMASARRIVEGDRYTRAGKWRAWGPTLFLGYDIHHATLGLVGLGRIGSEMAKRAQGFSMRVLYYDAVRREDLEQSLGVTYVDMDTLLRESDFVSLHTPLMPETRHLIGARELGMMKSTAILINSSRGPVVDQAALYEALRDKRIAHAGLDVFEVEPISKDDPLLTLDNVTVVPHVASASHATRSKMAVMAAQNLIAGLRGELPPNCVNPEAWQQG